MQQNHSTKLKNQSIKKLLKSKSLEILISLISPFETSTLAPKSLNFFKSSSPNNFYVFFSIFLLGQTVIEYLYISKISKDILRSIPSANPFVFPIYTKRFEAASFEKSFIKDNFTILTYIYLTR